MEASQAGLAPAAADAGGQGEQQNQQQAGPDLGQLASQLEQMAGSQEEMRQFLLQQPWTAQQEPVQQQEPEPDIAFDPRELGLLPADEYGIDPGAFAERLGGLVTQVAERRAQQLMQPLQERIDRFEQQSADARREAEAERLVGEFPELADAEIAQQVVSVARQLAEANGHPELANEPWLWRTVYMAGRAAEHAQQEGSEDPAVAHLEGGSGARPGGGAQQVDLAEQIVSARRGSSVLP